MSHNYPTQDSMHQKLMEQMAQHHEHRPPIQHSHDIPLDLDFAPDDAAR